jgi:transaldolase
MMRSLWSISSFFVVQAPNAQAALAFKLYQEKFSGPRWEALAKRGAQKQRALWASTGVKDPSYPDTLYVNPLIGPDTVSVSPDKDNITLLATLYE